MTRIEVIQHNINKLKNPAAQDGMSTFCLLTRAEQTLIAARATRKGEYQNAVIRRALGEFWFARGLMRMHGINC